LGLDAFIDVDLSIKLAAFAIAALKGVYQINAKALVFYKRSDKQTIYESRHSCSIRVHLLQVQPIKWQQFVCRKISILPEPNWLDWLFKVFFVFIPDN
jgi:hypothetical protein